MHLFRLLPACGFAALCCILPLGLSAADSPPFAAGPTSGGRLPAIPSEVRLTNGTVLHGVTVDRWNEQTVVLKHSGGTEPIKYDDISPAQRPIFEARQRFAAMAETVIAAHSLLKGMDFAQVARSWGTPNRQNAFREGHVMQWVYDRGEHRVQYVYFEDGQVTDWTAIGPG